MQSEDTMRGCKSEDMQKYVGCRCRGDRCSARQRYERCKGTDAVQDTEMRDVEMQGETDAVQDVQR